MRSVSWLWRAGLGLSLSLAPVPATSAPRVGPSQSCELAGPTGAIQHVVYLQFDNVHFARDNPNVPSDLEQMPHLLDFLTSNGVVLTNDHTALISHTATGILTAVTGVYPDSHGVPVSNTFRYFRPDGTSASAVGFGYWTAPMAATHPVPLMLAGSGQNAPAPWVPYTRAGCDFGAAGTANTILENTTSDIDSVFGAGSPERQASSQDATTDYVGVGIHCGVSDASVCAGAPHAVPDLLPNEPGSYGGFQMLQGHRYVAEQMPLTAIDGSTIDGFPGFDGMVPNVTLGYLASMLEHGVPVVYGYISDAHDNHTTGTGPFGPGEAGYVEQLAAYDAGFAGFFSRLANDGIDASNTLFVVTVDEGDHPDVGPPSPPDCDGVNVACTYARKGEVALNLRGLVATQAGVNTAFSVHADTGPTVYIDGNPDQMAGPTRDLERAVGTVRVDNPYTGQSEGVVDRLADQAEMGILHMLTADPARHPTFTLLGRDWFYMTSDQPDCSKPCVGVDGAAVWMHGSISPAITTIWMGLAGPGVRQLGVDAETWADHVDVRATLMALIGLRDDYPDEGRVLYEDLDERVQPAAVRADPESVLALQRTYKQINAPLGQLGSDSLAYITAALQSQSPNDQRYRDAVAELNRDRAERDRLANAMLAELTGVEFEGQPVRTDVIGPLVDSATALLGRVHALAR